MESCGKAAEQRQLAAARAEAAAFIGSGGFRSNYPGRCGGCAERFEPGDLIRQGARGYVGMCCG